MGGVIRVLACTSAEAERRLRKALSGDDLTMALTFPEAVTLLAAKNFDVVIVGMMFHESRALELMQLICRRNETLRVPVVAIRGAKLARVVDPEVFDVPMTALGAADVIDFASIPDTEAGNAQIGYRIRAALSAGRTLGNAKT